MNYHDHTPVFKNTKLSVLFELDYGEILREQLEFDRQKSISLTPRTVAYYASPDKKELSFSNRIT